MSSLFSIKYKKPNPIIFVAQVLFLFIAASIVLQLIKLQLIDPDHLKDKAVHMRQSHRGVNLRGEIVDRKGIRLAADKTSYDIYAHPKYYEISPEEIAQKLAPYLEKPADFLYEKLNKLNLSTVTLAKNINRDPVQKLEKLNIKGLDIVKKNERVYPQGNLASHILGYANPDANIFAGVEETGSKDLETFPNNEPIELDGRGHVIYTNNTDPSYAVTPPKGEKITLTIDSNIQHIAETELAKMITKTRADRGTVIIINPKNGEILGFAVLPSYNPSQYSKANPYVIKNWVLSDVYPPGSTFKILTIASALETGRITPGTTFNDTGQIKIQGWTITNYDYAKKGAPGIINLKYLFEHSSNVGSTKAALSMTPKEHYDMLRKFGIGSKTGIDLPGESSGIIPPYQSWDTIRHATVGFGYSIASTPIQIASAVAAIANDGVWITPHVIKYNSTQLKNKVVHKRVLSAQTSRELTKILCDSIEHSKASAGKIPNYYVAGKTGTSRKPNPNGPGYLENQLFTSFVGFFPVKNPQILMMVVVDNPKGSSDGIWGSTVAGPVFNEIATQIARIMNIPPDAPGINTKSEVKQ